MCYVFLFHLFTFSIIIISIQNSSFLLEHNLLEYVTFNTLCSQWVLKDRYQKRQISKMVCLLQEFKWSSEIDCLGHHSRVVLTTDLIKKMKNNTLEDLMKTLQISTTTSYHSINDLPMSSTSSTVRIHKKQCVKFTFSVLHSLNKETWVLLLYNHLHYQQCCFSSQWSSSLSLQ